MKQKLLFVFCIIVGLSGLVAAQARTVTNFDLEKYRSERIRGETDYRENYARLGFPSPAELERRREKSRIENEEFAAKLRAERLETERSDAARPRSYVYYQNAPARTEQIYADFPYFYSYGRYHRYGPRQTYNQPGYYAGGQFWPTPVQTPGPRAVWLRQR